MSDKKLYFFLTLFASVHLLHAERLPRLTIEKLTQPIVFSKEGIELFFTEQFNNTLYGDHILPAHFGHLVHFLHYSTTIPKPYDFVLTVFDIFHTRLKNTHWVNAFSLSLLLEQLPQYLEPICVQNEQEELQETIKNILYKRFISRLTKFSQNPMDGINSFDTFLQTIDEVINPTAQELSALLITSKEKQHVRDLQELVSRFIESALEKIVWNPKSQHDSWTSVCLLAEQIKVLHNQGILHSSKTVNHLYWTLLYRYTYFLTSSKDIVNKEVWDSIKNDIAMNSYEWLSAPETETLMTPKKDYLMYVLWECITEHELKTAQTSVW